MNNAKASASRNDKNPKKKPVNEQGASVSKENASHNKLPKNPQEPKGGPADGAD